ncbi:armadillo-type protein [Gorgonomyces haynaldii]|nr:armadillo-type protein [Gorgonomyces haynaldii]
MIDSRNQLGVYVASKTGFAFDKIIPLIKDKTLEQRALKALSSWIRFESFQLESVPDLAHILFQSLIESEEIEPQCDALIQLMSDNRLKTLERQVPMMLLQQLVSEPLQLKLKQGIQEEDEDLMFPLTRLLSQYGETFVKFIVKNHNLREVNLFLEMVFCCTMISPINNSPDIPEITLYFWFLMEESLDSTNELVNNQLDQEQQSFARNIFMRLLQILVYQIRYPPDPILSQWSKEKRERFQQHRIDCGDTILQCYYHLQEQALEWAIQSMNQDIQELEALIYCIKCFSESIPTEEDKYLPQFFTHIFGILQDSFTLKSTLLLMISGCAEWLSLNLAFLPSCFQFTNQMLLSPLSKEAARTLLELCNLCRHALSDHLQELITSGMQAFPHTDPSVRSQIIQSISYVAAASDTGLEKLFPIAQSILNQLYQAESKDQILDCMNLVKALCRGDFDQTNPKMDLSEELFFVSQRVLHFGQRDMEIVHHLSLMLQSTLKSSLCFFKPTDAMSHLILKAFETQPLSTWLQCAKLLIADEPSFINSLFNQCLYYFQIQDFMPNNPDVVAEFFYILSHLLRDKKQLLLRLDPNLLKTIFYGFLLSCFRLQESQSVTALLLFCRDFATIESPLRDQFMNDAGIVFVKTLVYCLCCSHPVSMSSKIADVLLQLISQQPDKMRSILNQTMQDGFPTPHTTPERKQKFIISILGTRSPKPFRDHCREFAIASRGLGQTTIHNA